METVNTPGLWATLREHFNTESHPRDRPLPTAREIQRLLFVHFFVRILSAFFVGTEFVPDEAWQSTEVAHHLVYGKGYLTWEWKYGLRSYLYPFLLSLPLRVLKFLNIDWPYVVILIPRLIHAILLFVGEHAFFRFNISKYGYDSAKWGLGAMIFCWFHYFCGCRNLTNVTETALNLLALNCFQQREFVMFTGILAINFVIRPTAVIYWIIFIPSVVRRFLAYPTQLVGSALVAITVLLGNLWLDYMYYGRLVVPWWNFFVFNFVEGKSAQFGTHPLFWYVYSGIPSIVGLSVVFVYLVLFFRPPRYAHECTIILVFLGVYSAVAHKEIRFLFPIIPHMSMIVGDIWEAIIFWTKQKYTGYKKFARTALLCALSANVVAAIVFSHLHQAGIYPASKFIHEVTRHQRDSKIWILMPCFSVPIQTYIHNPEAEFQFFTCSPPGLEYDSPNVQKGDFAEVDLLAFTRAKLQYDLSLAPDLIMLYSNSTKPVQSFFEAVYKMTYNLCYSHYHTVFPFDSVGERVDVLCKDVSDGVYTSYRLNQTRGKRLHSLPYETHYLL